MNLNIDNRAALTIRILRCLVETVPESEVLLRGSLTTNQADEYSDIDILWEVPDEHFQSCVENIAEIISSVWQVESIRSDPDFQNSKKRRLIFIRFEGVPLFWRLDLDILAKSIHRDLSYDVSNPDARGNVWSLTESALANAVAAVKWHLRGNEIEAKQLLVRAYQRIGLSVAPAELKELILQLTNEVRTADIKLEALADQIDRLVLEAF